MHYGICANRLLAGMYCVWRGSGMGVDDITATGVMQSTQGSQERRRDLCSERYYQACIELGGPGGDEVVGVVVDEGIQYRERAQIVFSKKKKKKWSKY